MLGRGGFATTYKARVLDEDLREDFRTDIVAVKVPADKKKERTLKRELEMNSFLHVRLRDLQSVNIVQYLGFCVFRNQIVMVMQYVSGGTLRELLGEIGRQKPMKTDEAIRICEGILNGLSAIHHERVFHRDIKPENILMEGKVPKIADLGISRMLDPDQKASTSTGTLIYMSPEIIQRSATFTSDIWSLGVTLYEMVTGQLPFGSLGMPIGQIIMLINAAEYKPASRINREVPPELDAIIARALQRDPADRYQTAEEMRRDLEKLRKKDSKVEKELDAVREHLATMEPSPATETKLLELLRRHPDEPRIYQYLGEYYNRCQRYGDAIDVFRDGIVKSPEYPLLYWNLALALQRKGQKKEAKKNLEQAVALGLDASMQRHANMLLQVLGK